MSDGYAYCTDPNPWDSRIRCQLPGGHIGRHEADGPIRWASHCHFPGDDCRPGHPADLEESA